MGPDNTVMKDLLKFYLKKSIPPINNSLLLKDYLQKRKSELDLSALISFLLFIFEVLEVFPRSLLRLQLQSNLLALANQ